MVKTAINYEVGSSVRTPSKGLAIGDSIVAAYEGVNAITDYLFTNGDYEAGYDVFNQAVPNQQIQQQKTIFLADPNRLLYDWGIIQVGVNNLANSNSYASIRNLYQDLVDSVLANTKTGFKLILSTMTPCKARLDAIGYSQTNFLLLNNDIRGIGSTPIIGAHGVCDVHTEFLADSSGNLLPEYESPANDHIHPNNAAKTRIALESWKPKLTSLNLFQP